MQTGAAASNTGKSSGFFRLFAALLFLVFAAPAYAAEPIKISKDDTALDLSRAVQIFSNQGEKFTVSTAPGIDGIVRRIEVEGNSDKASGDWAVFALANATDQQIIQDLLTKGKLITD